MSKEAKTILYLRADFFTMSVVAGGSVAHTLGVIQGLKNNGAKVLCAAASMREEIKATKPEHFKRLWMPRIMRPLWWRLNSFFSSFFQLFQILPLFKKARIDYIYQRYGLFNTVGVLLSFFKRVPLILEYNGSEVWVDKKWGAQRKWGSFGKLVWLSSFVEWLNLRFAHSIVVVSQVLYDDLVKRKIDPAKILINPNGVDVVAFNPAKLADKRIQIRRKFDIENKFVFGFIGSFSIWHGIDVLEKMIPEVLAEKQQAHFFMIGDGPLKKKIEETLLSAGVTGDQVTFTGRVPQEQGRDYLAACDAYLSPTQGNKDGTKFFGSPTKVFEYMSMGKPIIASKIEQVAQILSPQEGPCAVLVKSDDVQGFASACCQLIEKGEEFHSQMGMLAREKAIREHTWDAHVAKILRFVERNLQKGQREAGE